MKYFRLDWDEIVWNRSWPNLLMLSATIPSYSKEEDKKEIEKNGDLSDAASVWGSF